VASLYAITSINGRPPTLFDVQWIFFIAVFLGCYYKYIIGMNRFKGFVENEKKKI
jgi:hypothetical protein